MTYDEFRLQMETYRYSVNEEAMALKDSYLALERLRTMYAKFNSKERAMADRVLAEWALSEDENVRFDALALIDDFKISYALHALRKLADKLVSSVAPGAPYELRKVERIRDSLAGKGSKIDPVA